MDTAKLFKSGNSLAVRLPKKYALEGKEVYIERRGEEIVLIPKRDAWEDFWQAAALFPDDFMEERGQPEPQGREEF